MNKHVRDALFQAIHDRDIAAVHRAMDRGAHAGYAAQGGRTALMTAIRDDFLPAVRVLLKNAKTAHINAVDNVGNTALIYAAAASKPTFLQLLIRRQADLDHQNAHGYTALIRAIRSLRIKNIRILCKVGADLNKQDLHGHSALDLAAQLNRPDILDALLAARAVVDHPDAYGLTPLMRAAWSGASLQCVRSLLDAGSAIDRVDSEGWNVLMFAALGRNPEVLTYLLECGMDVQQKAASGKTAEDMAETDEARAILRAWRERNVLRRISGAAVLGDSPQEIPRRTRNM